MILDITYKIQGHGRACVLFLVGWNFIILPFPVEGNRLHDPTDISILMRFLIGLIPTSLFAGSLHPQGDQDD